MGGLNELIRPETTISCGVRCGGVWTWTKAILGGYTLFVVDARSRRPREYQSAYSYEYGYILVFMCLYTYIISLLLVDSL